ncbi:MAG TPA: cytochrome c [Desulfocapsa sulfexigens]|nr:cytochrome c [Desulfocapsa sulfexigens]
MTIRAKMKSPGLLFMATLMCLFLALPVYGEEKKEAAAVAAEEAAPKLEVSLELGRVTYQHYCTPCHGVKGDGNGFNAPHLLVKPANHTDSKFMSERNDTKLFDTINLGGVEVAKSTLMPPWGAALGDEKIKSLILYLRELCKCQATKNW